MPQGTLELLIVKAKHLESTDFLFKMDPYVILTCHNQEQESSVASGQGSDPQWNETLVFSISEGVTKVKLKIMDEDLLTSDDFVGEATISLVAVFEEGFIPVTSYNVVKDQEYCGEIIVGLTFIPVLENPDAEEESFGGWKQSEFMY